MNIIAHANGENDLIDIAQKIGADGDECISIAEKLKEQCVVSLITH